MITPVTSTNQVLPTAASSSSGSGQITNPSSNLGENDFLKLLITQLQNQDPSQPMDSSQFASQLAQYSSLEQMTQLNTSFGTFMSQNDVNSAVSLIGKTASATDPNNSANTITGTVSQISFSNGTANALLTEANGTQQSVPVTSLLTVQ